MSTQTVHTFALPDVGEGLTEAEIVTWHVAVGDTVAVNQVIVEIETAKSLVELPSPYSGEVVELLVATGTTVVVGTAIIAIGATIEPSEGVVEDDTPKLLVGYGASDDGSPRRRRGSSSRRVGETHSTATGIHRPRAKPPVRKLADAFGVDLRDVAPSGPDGVILRADVLAAAEHEPVSPSESSDVATRIPIRGVRKHTAAAMVASAFTAPHVTEFVTVDVTGILALREVVQKRREFRDVKLTPLVLIARAYLRALARTPMATARWDEGAQEIVVPATVNLGIAAATPRGLVVPNVKRADTLGLLELATAIGDLATTARAGKTTPAAMSGGTSTITNVGVFGIDTGTPILNPGETAILAVGAIQRRPWVVDDGAGERLEIRSVLQLALSFDHRVLDGQQGSEVLADTAAMLAEPGLARHNRRRSTASKAT
jgi:2-oxoisovalerate dehydrogenase E2 component (dihydrolipoyl transacylase)